MCDVSLNTEHLSWKISCEVLFWFLPFLETFIFMSHYHWFIVCLSVSYRMPCFPSPLSQNVSKYNLKCFHERSDESVYTCMFHWKRRDLFVLRTSRCSVCTSLILWHITAFDSTERERKFPSSDSTLTVVELFVSHLTDREVCPLWLLQLSLNRLWQPMHTHTDTHTLNADSLCSFQIYI